ncbi:MAG: type II toxin-antitoxin system HicB family antitoxin [Alphaproteobacteria bacterium]
MFAYPADIEDAAQHNPGERGFVVTFPDVPEAITQGDSLEEALAHASDALETGLSFYVDQGKDLPKPSARRRRPLIFPSLRGEMKLGLYQQMRTQKITKTALARRMGKHLMEVDRLLDLTHHSRIDQVEAAYAALGQRVNVVLVST